MLGSEIKDQNIPVRDKQGQDQPLPNVSFAPDARRLSDIQEEVLIQKERSNVIESALSRFRSGVEKVYSESRERSLGRMKVSEDEMSRKFSIGAVMQNDISELNKIGAENITKYLGEESAQILEQAAQMDCYVIREQLKSSQNKDEEEERAYREEIEKLRRKNIDLEQRIQQKKRLNKIENSMKQSSSTSRMAVQVMNNEESS